MSHGSFAHRARRCGLVLGRALIVIVIAASASSAAPPERTSSPPDAFESVLPARFVMGIKFGGGGTLATSPDNTVLGSDETGAQFVLPVFDETRAGYTLSAGFFLEGIFYEHLGLEVGMHFVQHTLLEEIEWSYTEQRGGRITTFEATSEEQLSWTAFHLPILIKAMVDTGASRISLGIGPEFAFTSYSRASFDITDGGLSSTSTDPSDTTFPRPECFDGRERLPGTRCSFARIGTNEKDSVYLSLVFGIEVTAGDFLIPIDIHWSYNFSQPSDYRDRVDIDPNTVPGPDNPTVRPSGIDLGTRDSMYGGLRIGLAYQFQ